MVNINLNYAEAIKLRNQLTDLGCMTHFFELPSNDLPEAAWLKIYADENRAKLLTQSGTEVSETYFFLSKLPF